MMLIWQIWNPATDFAFACKSNNNKYNSYIAQENISIVRPFSFPSANLV